LRWLIGTWLLASAATAVCASQEENPLDLTALSLEELMDVEVFSVSKKQEKLSESAAAAFVITPEDMRRAGVTSIPEALRMVPGMEVARIDANKWAISARGFNDIFANKLLVLIDGRSVYTPLFSGVFWEAQDVLLEDVERIEVIRGPGATLWGANAVNGIINVRTKSARDTRGSLMTLGSGSEERGFGSVRYGDRLRDDFHYRIYAKGALRDDLVLPSGAQAADGWNVLRGGFRLDWDTSDSDALILQGDIYQGDIGQTYRIFASPKPPYLRTFEYQANIAGGNVLGRWEHVFPDASDLALQVYYDRTEREEAVISGYLETFDLDFQHRFSLDVQQEILWGLGYRFTRDEFNGSFTSSFHPDSRRYDLISAFAQEEVSLADDRFRLTLGSKFEYSDFAGFEIQPSARLLWIPDERHTLWTAASCAVRTPSRADHDIRSVGLVLPPSSAQPDMPITVVELHGDRGFQSEELLAFEFGSRFRAADRLFLDLAAFYNLYDDLLTVEPRLPYLDTTSSPPYLVAPSVIDNRMSGMAYGAELAADAQVRDYWRLRAAYTFLDIHIDLDEDSSYAPGLEWEGVSPQHQLSLRSSLDLPRGLELDLWGRYVDALPDAELDSYLNLDARFGWNLTDRLELSLVGQNLLDAQHAEFRSPHGPTLNSDAQRGAYGVLRWRFEPIEK